jgi:hypothetical protein
MTEPIISRGARLMLILHYKEGWSLRRIAEAFRLHHWQVRRAIDSACDTIADGFDPDDCATQPFIEGLMSFEDNGEPRQTPRIAALRRDQLAQDLDLRMDMRSAELADVSECMGANCPLSHNRSKGPAWTQWEVRYLNETGRTTIAESAYGAGKRTGKSPAYYCAGNPSTCTLSCAGCRG